MSASRQGEAELSRRRALGVLVGTGSALALGCSAATAERDGGSDARLTGADAAGTDAQTAAPDGGADGAVCASTPEGEIGPYFADDSDARFNRRDILSNIDGSNTQSGIPLTLTIVVLDGGKGCSPYAGAQIDIWHCNASGVYSDEAVENTTTETWLRGYQVTDANGKVTFQTIVPGWYQGRTTHIHLRLRSTYNMASSTSDGSNTTQLFFAQTFVDRLATTVAPYNAEGKNPTTNASDHVYAQEENGANVLALAGDDTTGYSGAITLVLPIGGVTRSA